MNLLIPYVPLINHADPALEEFTYGDVNQRARKLKKELKKGEYIFFHTSINSRKYITAYYVVDRVLDVSVAAKDTNILLKYRNPHIVEYREDEQWWGDEVIVFGDPILSYRLERPLPFDKRLAKKLSLHIEFKEEFTETQCIGSATRSWREISDKDVEVLLSEAKNNERKGLTAQKTLSTDEVTDVIEKDLENFIEANPAILGDSLKFIGRQMDTPVGRIDLMFFEDKEKKIIIVELKLNKIGREALNQLRRYMEHVKKETRNEVEVVNEVEGVIVCKGVMPAFEEEFKNLKKVKVLRYGWKLDVSEV